MSDLEIYIDKNKKIVDGFIQTHFLNRGCFKSFPHNKFSLSDSMLYTAATPGKRIRPVMLLLSAESLGFKNPERLVPFAASIELIHSYSLIHDDLPSMDNDSMRRGKPTNHIRFGEATAILAGDALLAEAFFILSEKKYSESFEADKIISAINELSNASGSGGIVEGQFHDINSIGKELNIDEMEYINEKKTASLIGAACAMGAILAGAPEDIAAHFRKFGEYVGMAFQSVDDVLGITGNMETIGKTSGIDAINNKPTVAGLIGLGKMEELITAYNEKAIFHLESTGGETKLMKELVGYLTKRTK